jgi:hypothetical protein
VLRREPRTRTALGHKAASAEEALSFNTRTVGKVPNHCGQAACLPTTICVRRIFLKRFVISILLVTALAAMAQAATVDYSRWTIDIPEGWKAEEEGKMISLLAPGNTAAVSIVWDDSEGFTAKDLSAAMSQKLKGTTPKPDDGGYSFTFTNKADVESMSILYVVEQEYYMLTITGKHPQLGGILKSVRRNSPGAWPGK